MNTQSILVTSKSSRTVKGRDLAEVKPIAFAASVVRWSVAGTVALAVIIAGIWLATTPAVSQYLAAGLWAIGFVFFALALEVNIRRILPLIFTGVALPVLALLGSRLAEEFSVLAVAVVAGWLMFWIGRRS